VYSDEPPGKDMRTPLLLLFVCDSSLDEEFDVFTFVSLLLLLFVRRVDEELSSVGEV
jgi:hypothetical protein